MAIASDALNGISATAAPDGAPAEAAATGTSATAAGAAAGAEATAGAAAAEEATAATAESSASSSGTNESESVIYTRPSSRPTLYPVTSLPANCGRRNVLAPRLASVGALPRPTSTYSSTPRPPCSAEPNSRACVSIQRTGEANCQDSSSVSSNRPSF